MSTEKANEDAAAMEKNVGTLDKAVRVILGLALIALVFVGPKTPWGWIGIVPLLTVALGWCPLYSVLGVRTSGPAAKS